MKLIDAEPIIAKYKDYEYFSGYEDFDDGVEAGVLSVIDELENASEIDPVHAVGAVYCKECKYHDDEVYPDSEWELHDHQECWCNWWDSVMPLNGFCSEGRKDDTKNG